MAELYFVGFVGHSVEFAGFAPIAVAGSFAVIGFAVGARLDFFEALRVAVVTGRSDLREMSQYPYLSLAQRRMRLLVHYLRFLRSPRIRPHFPKSDLLLRAFWVRNSRSPERFYWLSETS